ncbi:peptidylprolyl isomerase FKBP-type [Archaeoglobus veneficus SNP6]|uniref:Peptidyl-prolyl cis-trans isomerase n=2 Tax=Archaeoglobus veneficus TaxID=58290 RepID=F2KMT8_ARCVS|nr:peptidylprolyl isomerase FKBP-type [Archaeoglobus veneficus SNP6]
MAIKAGDFIKVSYTAKLEDGTVIDTTDEEVAKEYGIYNENAKYGDITIVVGEGHVVKGLDEELVGKDVGFKGEIVVPPEKAFGEYDPENKEVVSVKRFKERPQPGQRVRIGDKVGTVERVIGRRAIIDYNHPLAGKTLIFDVEVKELIEDDAEKIKALFFINTGVDVEVELDGKKAVVEVPKGVAFSQYFAIGKFAAINAIFKLLDIEEIDIVERFKKEEEKAVIEAIEMAKGGEAEDTDTDREEGKEGEETEETSKAGDKGEEGKEEASEEEKHAES